MTNKDKKIIKRLNTREEENMLMADYMNMLYAKERGFEKGEVVHSIHSLNRFRHDWNWLMPVVSKVVKVVDTGTLRPNATNYILVVQSVLSDDRDKAFNRLLGLITQLGKNDVN